MDIIIIAGNRPNCACCGQPLKSWNPLIEKEECIQCIAEKTSNKLIECIKKDFEKIGIKTK